MRRRAAWLALALAVAGPRADATAASAPRPADRRLAGRVAESHPREGFFVLETASRKLPRVRIRVDRKTRWAGKPVTGGMVAAGERVLVIAVPTKERDTFRALLVKVVDPAERPKTAGPSRQ